MMRRAAKALGLLAVALLAGAGPAAAQTVTTDLLQRDPGRFELRMVKVAGTVGFVQAGQGFTLIDAGGQIRVLSSGPAVSPGERVEVEGRYRSADHVIEAFRVTFR